MKINKGQFTVSSKLEKLKFNLGRGKGHLLRYALNRFRWHYYPRLHYVSKFPDHIDLELSTVCDMHCPMCYTRTDEFINNVKRTIMDADLFQKLVDECAAHKAFSIRLSLRGEAFMHPNIVELTRYAKEKGIKEVSSLTNGLKLNPKMFEELLDAGLDWLTISFDGLGETYEQIRKPAKFDEAVEKIRAYHEIKQRKKSAKPVVKIQTVWPAIKDNPQAFYDLFNPIVDEIASNPLIDYLRKDIDIEYEEDFTCPVLWQRLAVGADGKVLLCVNDEFGKHIVGDANTESLYDIWHGKRLQEAREIHKKNTGVKMLEPCKECYLPRETVASHSKLDDRILTIEDYTNRPQEIGR